MTIPSIPHPNDTMDDKKIATLTMNDIPEATDLRAFIEAPYTDKHPQW